MKKQTLSEDFKRMQKLAGLIIENQNSGTFENFRESDEMGWMETTMEEIAKNEDLDLNYRNDFNIAFDEALNTLKQTNPELNFDLILKFKENMF